MFTTSNREISENAFSDDDSSFTHASLEQDSNDQLNVGHCYSGKDSSHFMPDDWVGELGTVLPRAPISLRLIGKKGAPVIFAMGGISADRFVADEQGKSGWWADLIKTDGAIDLTQYQVASIDLLTDSLKSALDLTTSDYAQIVHHILVDAGIHKLFAFVGASFGGLVGQAYAVAYPEHLKSLAVLCAAHKPSAIGTGWRSIQRKILMLAIESGKAEEGVAIARELAMTTYRTPEEFEGRFSKLGSVLPYLEKHGQRYAETTCPNKYITLSAAIDRHSLAPESIVVPTLIVGSSSDRLATSQDLREFKSRLSGVSWFEEIDSLYGHDAFLKETAALKPIISTFIKKVSNYDK